MNGYVFLLWCSRVSVGLSVRSTGCVSVVLVLTKVISIGFHWAPQNGIICWPSNKNWSALWERGKRILENLDSKMVRRFRNSGMRAKCGQTFLAYLRIGCILTVRQVEEREITRPSSVKLHLFSSLSLCLSLLSLHTPGSPKSIFIAIFTMSCTDRSTQYISSHQRFYFDFGHLLRGIPFWNSLVSTLCGQYLLWF